MKYDKTIALKSGKHCHIRNGIESDGQAVVDCYNLTHGETDFLLSYPEENSYNPEKEGIFLKRKTESENEVELVAEIDGKIVGTAGIEAVGAKYKVRHRAELGISVAKEFWGLGIGRALIAACIECAWSAGYIQLELNVVAENERAISLYKAFGFSEYGRNPKGFNSRTAGFQELVYMRMEL